MSGFSKLDLTGFKPGVGAVRDAPADEERVADRVAERHGLPGDPVGRVPLNRGKTVQDRMFVQGPLATLNRFRSFCNDRSVPLHKGLEMLLDQFDR